MSWKRFINSNVNVQKCLTIILVDLDRYLKIDPESKNRIINGLATNVYNVLNFYKHK